MTQNLWKGSLENLNRKMLLPASQRKLTQTKFAILKPVFVRVVSFRVVYLSHTTFKQIKCFWKYQGIGAQALLRSNCAPEQPGALILALVLRSNAPEHKLFWLLRSRLLRSNELLGHAPEHAPGARVCSTCSGLLQLNALVLFTKICNVVSNQQIWSVFEVLIKFFIIN